MKNLFYLALATALLFTSCNKEEKFEAIECEDDVMTRAGEGDVNVSFMDNTLYFTWDNRFVESISITVTDNNNNRIYYLPFTKLTTTSLSHTYSLYNDGFFKIEICYTEPNNNQITHSDIYYCESGRVYKLGKHPQCYHRCFEGFPDRVRVFGNFIELDLVGEYTMIVYSSSEHGKTSVRDLKLKLQHISPLIPIDIISSGVGVSQKVRIFTKDCPYGPGVCNSFIEARIPIQDSGTAPTSSPTGYVCFEYCNRYWDY